MLSAKIENHSKIFDQGLLDSMGLRILIEYLNERFQVEGLDDELEQENFECISNMASFISRKKSKDLVKINTHLNSNNKKLRIL